MPTVSILLPTYKKPPHIKKSIGGVLSQSFSDWELIIIDDGLIDAAKKEICDFVANDPRILIITNPKNLGIQKTLNLGTLEAKGKYIARIDDDDQWIDKDKLKKQVEFLDSNPDYVLVGTDGIICDENLVDLRSYSMPKSDLEIRNRILFKNCFLHSSVMIRKDALEKVSGYCENKGVRHVEDYDLWLRLGLIGKIINLDTTSVRLIVNSGSVTSKNRLLQSIRDIFLTIRYSRHYPHFLFALLVAFLRLFFFSINSILPLPKRVLYKLQAMYKAI